MRDNVVTPSSTLAPVQISGPAAVTASQHHSRLIPTSSSPRKIAVNLTCRKSTQPAVTEKRNNLFTIQLPINLGSGSGQPRFNLGETAPNRAKPRSNKKYFRRTHAPKKYDRCIFAALSP